MFCYGRGDYLSVKSPPQNKYKTHPIFFFIYKKTKGKIFITEVAGNCRARFA